MSPSDFAHALAEIQANLERQTTQRLQASRAVLEQVGQAAEQYMQGHAPQPDSPLESPQDWTAKTTHPADLHDGGVIELAYTDPLGVLSARDADPTGEDSGLVIQAADLAGPQLVAGLKEVW